MICWLNLMVYAPARVTVTGKGIDTLSSDILSVNRRVDFIFKK